MFTQARRATPSLTAPLWIALLAATAGGCATDRADGDDWACHPDAYAAHAKVRLPLEGDIGDPHVIRVDGRWYLYPSQAENRPHGLQVLVSDDLVHWEDKGLVWRPTPGSWNAPGPPLSLGPDCLYWAPSVHRGRDGAFYLYYAARCRIGVARADSPLGPFVDLNDHPLVGSGFGDVGTRGTASNSYDQLAIDPFLLDDPTEGLLLYFVAYTPTSNLYAIHLSSYGTTRGSKKLLMKPDVYSWESAVLEGVWVERVAGDYHLMYSGNFVRTTGYAIGAARSDSALGPFERYAENPILATSKPWKIYGPGHHSVVAGAHRDRLIFYHADESAGKDALRAVHLASLCRDARSGRLVVRPDATSPPP